MVCLAAASRRQFRTLVAALAGLAVVLVAPAVRALNFPLDTQWVPLTCNGDVLTDAAGEVQPAASMPSATRRTRRRTSSWMRRRSFCGCG
jgi:hypothetical protein